jgi:ribosomal protein S18 acetylase RimI-like enzyme
VHDGSAPLPTIRVAERADVVTAAGVLARAFHHDPVYEWMIPDETLRRRALPKLFVSLLRRVHLRHQATELAEVDGEVVGIAIWDPPGHWKTPAWRQLTQVPDLIAAFGRQTPAMLRGFSALAEIENRHPGEPHWYLVDAATDPTQQGRGLGHRLLRRRLEQCDTNQLAAYLEASSPRNQRLYERLGFVATGEITLPGGPTVIPMWRSPAPRGDSAARDRP